MTLAEQQKQLLATLAPLKDAQARFAWLVEQARQRPILPPEFRTDAYRVQGCLAKLWFVPEFRDGLCYFRSESDSLVVKSIAGLLCDFYSGHEPAAVAAHHPDFLTSVGITQHMTPNRRHTLTRIWEQIREFALSKAAAAS